MAVITNILALPLVTMSIQVRNNEDWIGSVKFLVEDPPGNLNTATMPQLDLRGIHFEMEMRRSALDHEVVLGATTDDGTLAIGVPPDYGYLIINIPVTTTKMLAAGDYVADVVATADGFYRVCLEMTVNITEGVTKWP